MMRKKINLSSFSGGILAGGIVITIGNIPVVLETGYYVGLIAGIMIGFLGVIMVIFTNRKNQDKNRRKS